MSGRPKGSKNKKEEIIKDPIYKVNHILDDLKKNQVVLMNLLNVLDLDEYLEKLTEQEKKDYEAEASMIYNNKVFRKELKYLFGQQALYVATQSDNWDRTLVGRGSVNGIALVEERFKTLDSRYKDRIKPVEEFDKHGLMAI